VCGSDGSGELSFEELKELLPVVDMAPKDDAEVGNHIASLCPRRSRCVACDITDHCGDVCDVQVIRIMKTLDKDGSGELSFEEFVNLLFRLMYGIDFD
jgi:hypothetical protein